jgi:hypothetical protein
MIKVYREERKGGRDAKEMYGQFPVSAIDWP